MKWMFKHGKIKKKLLLAEIVLLVASVFVFRGLWNFLDIFEFMWSPVVLLVSFVLGMIFSVLALRYIVQNE